MKVLKIILYLFLILIVAVGGFFGWAKWEDKRDRESVSIEIGYALPVENICPKNYPLRIKVINKSKRIVDKVNFNVVAKAVGRSNDLVRFYDARHDFDIITEPNFNYAGCYALPKLKGGSPPDLIWTTSGKAITFRKGKIEMLEDWLGLSIITKTY